MIDPEAAEKIRQHALTLLHVIDDTSQQREVRVFGCHVVGWALLYVRDEMMFSDMLTVLQRAIDRGDEPPLLLLHELHSAMHRDHGVAEAVARLGERALGRGQTLALTRVIHALARYDDRPKTVRAPARWIRAMVGPSSPASLEDVDPDVLSAVATWLYDEGSEVDAVRDLIPDPAAWRELDISRM